MKFKFFDELFFKDILQKRYKDAAVFLIGALENRFSIKSSFSRSNKLLNLFLKPTNQFITIISYHIFLSSLFLCFCLISSQILTKVTGYVVDSQKVTRYVISGIWDQKAECAKVVYRDSMLKPGAKVPQGNAVSKAGNPQTLPPTMLWVKKPLKYVPHFYIFRSYAYIIYYISHQVFLKNFRGFESYSPLG